MVELAVFIGLSFAFFCGILALVHCSWCGRITLLDWSLLAVGGMYGLGWVLVVLVTNAGGNPFWQPWITPFQEIYPIHTLAACLLVIGILIGWFPFSKGLPISRRVVSSQNIQLTSWSVAFWMLLFISLVCQWLYAQAYGGLLEMLKYTDLIRSSLFDFMPNNPWSFLQPFGGLAMISAYGFFGLNIGCRCTAKNLLGLLFSFLFSLYILYSWSGRIEFLVFISVFILGELLSRKFKPLVMLVFVGSVFAGILILAYGVSLWLNIKAADTILEFLARELAYPFGSFFAQWDQDKLLYRGFIDFILTPLFLLPSSWWATWYESADQVNTTIIMGAPKGEAGVTGGIPVDLLTLGLMQAHLLGVIAIGTMFGLFLRFLQVLIDCIPLIGVRSAFEAYVALHIATLAVFYAQPNLVISGNFALIVGGLMIFFVLHLPKIRFARL